jgi:hypothetical protein
MRFTTLAAFVLVSTTIGAAASAQVGQGRLTGIVTDVQHAVLPGVTVVATSPSLIGRQTAITQSDGRYLFPALPSGVYTVRFELSDFQTLVREGIVLSLATTITVDVELALAAARENVVVTAASPMVDVTTSKVGMNLKGEALASVPNSTDVWGVLAESPGIRMQGFDVGGSHKSQQSSYEVFGIQNQTRVISDGIDHTEGVGGTGFYEDYYANEEVSVNALGSDVEMNGGGAAIVTTVKSGGNVLRGLEHLSYEPGGWIADNRTPALEAQGSPAIPTCSSGKPTQIWEDRSGRIVCGSSTPSITSRSTKSCLVCRESLEPISASSTTTRQKVRGSHHRQTRSSRTFSRDENRSRDAASRSWSRRKRSTIRTPTRGCTRANGNAFSRRGRFSTRLWGVSRSTPRSRRTRIPPQGRRRWPSIPGA